MILLAAIALELLGAFWLPWWVYLLLLIWEFR